VLTVSDVQSVCIPNVQAAKQQLNSLNNDTYIFLWFHDNEIDCASCFPHTFPHSGFAKGDSLLSQWEIHSL
jgi:hypothetical protein